MRDVKPFKREHRPLGPSKGLLKRKKEVRYAAGPDDAADLRAIADQVRDMPKEWLQSREDLFHAMRRVGGRIAGIADRLAPIDSP